MPKEFQHLPSHSYPINYDLNLALNLKEMDFFGQVKITVKIVEDTDVLILNCLDLSVNSADFNGVPADSITYGSESEQTLVLKFPNKLLDLCMETTKLSTGCLCVTYSGQLSNHLRGFYHSIQRNGSDAGIGDTPCALTMLCPTEARRLLPCWDEPQLKATFQVDLLLSRWDPGLTVLSNMPEDQERSPSDSSSSGEFKCFRFAKTPPMSTYLLAIVVGRFDRIETVCQDGVLLRVFTPLGRQSDGQFALDVAKKSLQFYVELFGIAYPLPKLDLVAVPELAVGAMENWGLVTYREAMLLIDANSSKVSMETVALVVGHEVAHQWFGNLVTMQWWTQLWLNEGFASWIEYLCIDHCYPEFDVWTRFIRNDFSKALELDCLDNSHPIEVDVGHPDEIDEMFDAISYSKGASIIRMLHAWLGHEAFRNGLRDYLKTHCYGNATTADLWRALSLASGKPVERVMHAWVRRKGFPVISASLEHLPASKLSEAQLDGDSAVTKAAQPLARRLQLRLRQSRFRTAGQTVESAQEVGDNTELDAESGVSRTLTSGQRQAKMAKLSNMPEHVWRVPLEVQLSCESEPRRILLESGEQVYPLPDELTAENGDSWLKINWQCVGVYRVDYSDQMLDSLVNALKQGKLDQKDRFNLQSDLFALAAYGKLVTTRVLDIVKAYRCECYYTVWCDLLANLGSVQVLADQLSLTQAWHSFLCYLCRPAFQRLGWDPRPGEGHDAGLLRGLLIAYLGQAGEPKIVREALARFGRHATGHTRLEPDIRAGVYSTAARHGGPRVFQQLLDLLDAGQTGAGAARNNSSEEELRILRALGNTEDPGEVQRVLELSISDRVRQQDSPSIICALCACGGLKSRRLAWQFVKDRWSFLVNRYSGMFLLQRLVLGVCSGLCSAEDADDLRQFFASHAAPSASRSVRQALETVQLRAKLLSQDGEHIAQYLASLQAAASDDTDDTTDPLP